MVRFLFTFLALLGVFFGLQLTPWGQEYFVVPWTTGLAHFCAQLVAFFDETAVANGQILRNTVNGFAVSIEAGCNGVEATLVLLAGVLAFPSTFKQKLWGLGVGFIAVQGVNVIRIISLFYIGQWNKTAFDWAHLYIWQALIMIDVLVVFLIWLNRVIKSQKLEDDAGGDEGAPPSSGGSNSPSAQPA
jgi:exosortase H (IPTLxxWG-CTERM-specific)